MTTTWRNLELFIEAMKRLAGEVIYAAFDKAEEAMRREAAEAETGAGTMRLPGTRSKEAAEHRLTTQPCNPSQWK